jgi:hypothetical protein
MPPRQSSDELDRTQPVAVTVDRVARQRGPLPRPIAVVDGVLANSASAYAT